MQLSRALFNAFGAFGLFLCGGAEGTMSFPIGGRTINKCNDIPYFATVEGELTFAKYVECDVDDKRWIEVVGDVTIKTADGGHMNMTNIDWLVRDVAHATFVAPTVTISRTEDVGTPLFFASGTVEFRVDGWHESFEGGALEDRATLTNFFDGGHIFSGTTVHYQDHSIVAANPRVDLKSAEKAEGEHDPSAGSGTLFETDAAAVPVSGTNPTSPPIPQDGGEGTAAYAESTKESLGPAAAGPAAVGPSIFPTGAGSEKTANARVSPTDSPRDAETVPGVESSSVTSTSTTSGDTSSPSSVQGNVTPSDATIGNIDSESAQPDGSTSGFSASRKNNAPPPPKRNIPHDTPWARTRERSGSAYSPNSRPVAEEVVVPPDFLEHPEPLLRVGGSLTGKLYSADGTAFLYPGWVDGSVRFGRSTGRRSVDDKGRPVGDIPQEVETLIAANHKKVVEMYELRLEAMAELAEREATEVGRKGQNKEGLGATFKRSLPFGKAGFRYRRKIERAKAHLKEVEVTLTGRGKLEVRMDGMLVLRKSGPSFLGWRRRDPTYVLQTTRAGLEVTREGKLDWNVDAHSP